MRLVPRREGLGDGGSSSTDIPSLLPDGGIIDASSEDGSGPLLEGKVGDRWCYLEPAKPPRR